MKAIYKTLQQLTIDDFNITHKQVQLKQGNDITLPSRNDLLCITLDTPPTDSIYLGINTISITINGIQPIQLQLNNAGFSRWGIFGTPINPPLNIPNSTVLFLYNTIISFTPSNSATITLSTIFGGITTQNSTTVMPLSSLISSLSTLTL